MVWLKAVFFDLGGTLMEDAGDAAAKVEALAAVNARYGIEKTGEETLAWFLRDLGPYYAGQPEKWTPIRDHLRRNFVGYLREHSIEAHDEDCAWFEATYNGMHVKMCRLYPDALGLVKLVRGLRLHVGLLTDVDETWVHPVLDAVGLARLLNSVTTSEKVGVGKPNPGIFRAALEAARCVPAEALLVGDSPTRDIAGAKGVGMRALYIARSPEPATHADFTTRSLEEAADIIEGLAHG